MNLYLVRYSTWDYTQLVGIFDTLEKAEDAKAKYIEKNGEIDIHNEVLKIEKFELNQICI